MGWGSGGFSIHRETLGCQNLRYRKFQNQVGSLCRRAGHWAEDGDLTDGQPCLLLGNAYATFPCTAPYKCILLAESTPAVLAGAVWLAAMPHCPS